MVSVGIEVPAGQSRMFHQFRRSGSIPIARSITLDDSIALTPPNLPNETMKRGVLVPSWSQLK